jgi:hypothetical protein
VVENMEVAASVGGGEGHRDNDVSGRADRKQRHRVGGNATMM